MALEEAVNVSPGNTYVLANYLMLLLEKQNFEMFKRALPHAKRIMDAKEFLEISKLYEEFQLAVAGSTDATIPEDKPVVIQQQKSFDQDAKRSLKQSLLASKVHPIQEEQELPDFEEDV